MIKNDFEIEIDLGEGSKMTFWMSKVTWGWSKIIKNDILEVENHHFGGQNDQKSSKMTSQTSHFYINEALFKNRPKNDQK